MDRQGLREGGESWDAAALEAAGWSGVPSACEHLCPEQTKKEGRREGAPQRSLWDCWGSAPACGWKAFQGSTRLQGCGWAALRGQMVEEERREGEAWAEGAREHENQKDGGRSRPSGTQGNMETWRVGETQRESGARKGQEMGRNKGYLWREREGGL